MKVNEKGSMGNPIVISQTSPERASGFPQLEKVGSQLYWHGLKFLKIVLQ